MYAAEEPKTKKSRRTIRLTSGAVDSLRAHLSRQPEETESTGPLYHPGGCNLSFKPPLSATKIRNVRFHDLRRTHTSLLSKNVNPKTVSEMLGHASVSITLDTYSHLMPDMQEKAARALEELLS